MNYKRFELPPTDGHKSYYRKAWVTEYTNGDRELTSYNTVVCKIDADGHFIRYWGGYSATTQRHVNSFLDFYSMPRELRGKSAWDRLPVESQSMVSDMTCQESLRVMIARRNGGRYTR